MLAGYSFWSLTTASSPPWSARRSRSRSACVFVAARRRAHRAARVPAAAHRRAAGEARLLARRAAHRRRRRCCSRSAPRRNRRADDHCRDRVVRCSMRHRAAPVDRFILAGTGDRDGGRALGAVPLDAFGLATRAASENEVAAMPRRPVAEPELSMANTLITSLSSCRSARDPGRLGGASSTPITLPLADRARARRRPAARASPRSGSRAPPASASASLELADRLRVDARPGSRRPTAPPIPGVKELLAFVIIVVAMFLRGAAARRAASWSSSGCPRAPRPQRLLVRGDRRSPLVCAVALVVLPFDFRQALDRTR